MGRKLDATSPEQSQPQDSQDVDLSDSMETLIIQSLDQDKAEDIISIPLAGKSSFADSMVIATGRSNRQVAAMANHLVSRLKDAGYGTARAEGMAQGDWVLIDAGDVVVHLFRPEVRAFYNLESMWSADLAQSQKGQAS